MHFLSVDWGTSSLRIRLVNPDSQSVIAGVESPLGCKRVHEEATRNSLSREVVFRTRLIETLSLIDSSLVPEKCPIIISGMASSSIGLRELTYARAPLRLTPDALTFDAAIRLTHPFEQSPLILWSGVATADNVMRGEECELLGLLSLLNVPDDAKLRYFILPGTHSKHVLFRGHELISFSTYLTGELFELLHEKSVLADTFRQKAPDPTETELRQIELRAVDEVKSGRGLASLFKIRAQHLLQNQMGKSATHYLSSLLISLEMAELSRQFSANVPDIILAGSSKFADVYARIIRATNSFGTFLAVDHSLVDRALITGHCQLYARFFEKAGRA